MVIKFKNIAPKCKDSAKAPKKIEEPQPPQMPAGPPQLSRPDLRSVGSRRAYFPIYNDELKSSASDLQRIKKAVLREKKMLKSCQPKNATGVKGPSKKTRKKQRQYLRSKACLIANMLEAELRRPVRKRLSLHQIIKLADQYDITKKLDEDVRLTIMKKPDGGERHILSFGPVARGAQRMCAKLIRQNYSPKAFQFPGLGHTDKVKDAIRQITEEGYIYYVEIDIKSHYDSFARETLSATLPITAKATDHIVCASSAFIHSNQDISDISVGPLPAGIPQGGPVSDTVAEWSISHLDQEAIGDCYLINHADNFFLFAKSPAALEAGRNALSLAITKLPGGSFTGVVKQEGLTKDGFTMLGYVINFSGNKPLVQQKPEKAHQFTEDFYLQAGRTNSLLWKSYKQPANKLLRMSAVHEFTRLRAMLAGWENIQSICTVGNDGVQAEMETEIDCLQGFYKIDQKELAKAVDPYTSHFRRHGITS